MPRWLKSVLRPVAWGLALGMSAAAYGGSGDIRSSMVGDRGPSQGNSATTEVIRERYSNGALRIERDAAQDAEGNYFNHGPWKMWDAQGRLMGTGQYVNDQRSGPWVRFYKAGEAELISGAIGRQFEAPFASHATFVNGQLHGKWIITDAQQREVIRWQYENGKRNGKCVWWFPNGLKWREANYRDGEAEGELTEWTPNNRVVAHEQYVDGRRWGTTIEWYQPGIKKAEVSKLFAREITQIDENWWAGYSRELLTAKEGRDVRHGRSVTYYRNGQKAIEANYENDEPSGQMIWWHPNGAPAIEGQYAAGKQTGTWDWWHANGQKWIEGDYQAGVQVGRWTWWTDAGKVVEAAHFVDEDGSSPSAGLRSVDGQPELSSPPAPHRASYSQPIDGAAGSGQGE